MTAESVAELRDLLAAHEARLVMQEADNAALRAQFIALQSRTRPHRHSGGFRHWLGSLAVALLIALVPLGLLAASPFTDLTGGVHDPNIEAIYDAGVTKGCVPDTEYCPTANVTREEMASFLARLGGLGSNPPVADAKTLQGKPASDFLASTGEVDYRYSFYNVVPTSTSGVLSFDYQSGPAVKVEANSAGVQSILLPLDAPVRTFNRGLAVRAVAICYERKGGIVITSTILRSGTLGQDTTIFSDSTDRDSADPECYILSSATPEVADGALYLLLTLNIPQNALSGGILLYSVRLTLVPVLLP